MGGGVKWRQVEGTGEGSGAVHRHLRPLPGSEGPGDPPAQVPGRAGAGHGDHQGRRQGAVPVRVPPGRVRGLRGQAPQPAPDRPPDPGLRPHVRGRGQLRDRRLPGPGGDPPAAARVRRPDQGRGPARPDPPGRDLGQGGVRPLPEGRRGRLRRRDQRRPPGRAGDLMVLTAARHDPVMIDRVTELLRPRPGGVYVDATLGLGGHAERLLEASAPDGRVVGLDRDPAALALARQRLAWASDRLEAVNASFADLGEVAARVGLEAVDGVVYDLGVSSLQLDEGERGFSYRADAPLDMRMDPTAGITAAEVLATYPRAELARILREYGEERFAGRIARVLDEARRRAPITTTGQLAELVKAAVPAAARRTGPHPARRAFQALRIEVNRELDALRASLPQALDLLAPGGRLVVLAYHSLEDRIVKQALGAAAGRTVEAPHRLPVEAPAATPATVVLLTRRPERPSAAEVAANPRAESAKLRAAEKLPPTAEAPGGQP